MPWWASLSTSGPEYEALFPPIDTNAAVENRSYDCVMVFETGSDDVKFVAPAKKDEIEFDYLQVLLLKDKREGTRDGMHDFEMRKRVFGTVAADMVDATASMKKFYRNETVLVRKVLNYLGLNIKEIQVELGGDNGGDGKAAYSNNNSEEKYDGGQAQLLRDQSLSEMEESSQRRGGKSSKKSMSDGGVKIGQSDLRFFLAGIPEITCRRKGEEFQMQRAVEAHEAMDAFSFRNEPLALNCLDQNPENTHIDAEQWEFLFLKYNGFVPPQIYQHYEPTNEFDARGVFALFNIRDRIDLIYRIISTDIQSGGAGLSVEKMRNTLYHPMYDFFPLHEPKQRKMIQSQLFDMAHFLAVPLDNLQSYFGTYIALYFAFLQFYIGYLLPLVIVGTVYFVLQIVYGTVLAPGLQWFALFVAVWGLYLPILWRKEEWMHSYHWGQLRFHKTEMQRPEFEGEYRASEINGRQTEFYSRAERDLKRILSASLVVAFLFALVISTAGVVGLRMWVDTSGQGWGEYAVSVANALVIMFFNVIYGWIAESLNDWENYETESDYENNLILKVFIFRFVNSYASLYYMAFVRRYEHFDSNLSCETEECMSDVSVQLAVIFATQLIVGNLTELGSVWMSRAAVDLQEMAFGDGVDTIEELVEREYLSAKYDRNFEDYNELIVSLGYSTLFVVACPIAPLLAWASAIVELRIDGYKLIALHQRPFPRQSDSIGAWRSVLEWMAWAVLATNLFMVCVMTNMLRIDIMSKKNPELTEFVTAVLLFVLLYLWYRVGAWLYEGMPEEYKKHVERIDYLESVIDDCGRNAEKTLRDVDIDWQTVWEASDVCKFLREVYFGDESMAMANIYNAFTAPRLKMDGQTFKNVTTLSLTNLYGLEFEISEVIIFYRDLLRKETKNRRTRRRREKREREKAKDSLAKKEARRSRAQKQEEEQAKSFSIDHWIRIARYFETMDDRNRKRIWDLVDVNMDGVIDRDEFPSLLHQSIEEYISENEPSRRPPPSDDDEFNRKFINPIVDYVFARFVTDSDPCDRDRFTNEFAHWIKKWIRSTGKSLDDLSSKKSRLTDDGELEPMPPGEWNKESKYWKRRIKEVISWYSDSKPKIRTLIWDSTAKHSNSVDTKRQLKKLLHKMIAAFCKRKKAPMPKKLEIIEPLLIEMCLVARKSLEKMDEEPEHIRRTVFVDHLMDVFKPYFK